MSESETLSVLRDLVALSRDEDFSWREWYPVWVRARAVVDGAASALPGELVRDECVDRVAEAALDAHLVGMYGELPLRPGWWDSLDLEVKQTWRAVARAAVTALGVTEDAS